MSKLSPQERARRRMLWVAVALDYDCDRCSAHAGWPCQSTGRSRHPGTACAPHKPRMNRAFGDLALRAWDLNRVSSAARERFMTAWNARTKGG